MDACMRTEIDLNECEHFLKENLDRFECADGHYIIYIYIFVAVI